MSKSFSRFCGSAVVCLLLADPQVSAGQVVINEIMFHPPPAVPEQPAREWIELFNFAATNVNLNGWRLSKGVDFAFTNISIPAGGYLVVAANVAAFATNYPTVVNVVGDWTGKLRNGGETIQLEDGLGNRVDEVAYSNEGDWALRRVGEIYPGQPGWWRGWQWLSPADGGGKTLELRNPSMPRNAGQNWGFSVADGGTPGRPNSVLTNDIAPIISEVDHYPALPHSTNTVTITARLRDELGTSVNAYLVYRLDGASGFTTNAMFDDGSQGDGLSEDGIYGIVLPPQPDKTVVEFFVLAADASGHRRTWPAPTDDEGTQGANALYQVDESEDTARQPLYRLVTTAAEYAAWVNLMDSVSNGRYSDATMNGTLVRCDGTGTETRYTVGVRNRGAGTRAARPHNLHVNIPADRPLQGVRKLNFNTRFVHSQVAGNFIYNAAGLLNSLGAPVQVRVNGNNLANAAPSGDVNSFQFGSYYSFEPYDSDWAERHSPQDSGGNIYKGVWFQDNVGLATGAFLQYLGTNPAAYKFAYGPSGPTSASGPYSKDSNASEDDWSDLIHLTDVLNNTPDAAYLSEVSKAVNIDQWLRYFALNSLLLNMETTLATGVGDDYSSYRGAIDTRFQLLSHDFDTVLGQGDATPSWTRSIFKAADNAVMSRLLKHPEIAPLYLAILKEYAETLFATNSINGLLDQCLGGWVPENYIDSVKNSAYRRLTNAVSQIPQTFSAHCALPVSGGYFRSTGPSISLTGTADAIKTRAIVVNGKSATYTAWQGAWSATNIALNPGINRVSVQAIDARGATCASTNLDIWYDTGSTTPLAGPIVANTILPAAGGPYLVSANLQVANGATLTIEPGASLYLGPNVVVSVANGSRISAEGTPAAPIRFTSAPGSGAWGGIVINGAGASPESRFAYVHFDHNGTRCMSVAGGTVFLSHCTFNARTQEYLSLDSSSFFITDCVFPATTSPVEPIHGSGGIKPGGRGIFRNCYFGSTVGNHDVLDFTGGNRGLGEPILQLYNNVFAGGTDDLVDLDGTDAWVEGNIFLHAHKNGGVDSSAAIAGSNSVSGTSEVTIIGNIFYDCDHAATAKNGNFYTLLNNTIVRTSRTGGTDNSSAVINLRDTDPAPTGYGAGMYLEGNIVVDAPLLARNYDAAQSKVTFTNNLLPLTWNGPGGGNSTNQARLKHIPQVAETQFSNWHEAQVLREWFALGPGSPASGTGPNGTDMGAVRDPMGASISGVPPLLSPLRTAQLTVGSVRSGNFIPASGWPGGAGYTHYRWRLWGTNAPLGSWSAETPSTTPIVLENLDNGVYHVEVSGKRDSGWYQDAAELEGTPTVSRSWTVDTNRSAVRINEVLARNGTTFVTNGESPDLIELYNAGSSAASLAGMGLTDDPANPYKFTFGAGASLGSGKYLVLLGEAGPDPSRYLGFGLGQTGDTLYLFDKPANGGRLIDSVSFGPQLVDYSIGTMPDGQWTLCRPTFGGANVRQCTGDPGRLRINEWLTAGLPSQGDDFVELFNRDSLPVCVGGLFLSDAPDGCPALHPIAPLSFVGPSGVIAFKADGRTDKGPDHLGFALNSEFGSIGLFDPQLRIIDLVVYGPQKLGISQGRAPDGADAISFFSTPTPGSGNPLPQDVTLQTTRFSLLQITNLWRYTTNGTDLGTAWRQPGYADSGWASGRGLLGVDPSSPFPYPYPVLTPLQITNSNGTFVVTHYFRTKFNVPTNLAGFTIDTGIYLDDGAIFYLNGVDIGRIRLPSGSLSASVLATNQSNEGLRESLTIPASAFQVGDNTLAVEVHQTSIGSTDFMLGMSIDAYRTIAVTNMSGVMLNEILADNGSGADPDGVVADWVEIFNPTTNRVSLAGYGLSDNVSNPGQWRFPAGVTIEPGAFLLVRCDSGAPASVVNGPVLNSGVGLSSSGDGVYLFNASSSLVDGIKFGPQASDFSIGRIGPGSGSWTITLPTPRSENVPATTASAGDLRINEWAASVPNGPDWFEIYNPNPQPVPLQGLFLTDKLSNRTKHVIPALTVIGVSTNGYLKFVADNDLTQGDNHVGFSLDGSLGEALGLFPPGTGPAIDTVVFGPQTSGGSQGRLPDGTGYLVFFPAPSPGEANWLPLQTLQISEVLTHTDLPLEDAVELYNPTDQPAFIGGWYLSDSSRNLRKYRIPENAVVPARGYKVLYEYEFNFDFTQPECFSFSSSKGDEIWLTQMTGDGQPTGYRDRVEFGPQFNGVSFGRYQTSTGTDFVALSRPSFGTDVSRFSPTNQIELFRTGEGGENAYPRVGPIVISEIMYRPPPIGTNENVQDEFIELHNLSGVTVPLYDPAHPTNGWRFSKGVGFTFGTAHSIPPGGFLLLVSFDPATNSVATAAFRAKYGTNAPLVGPYSGRLSDNGEGLELEAPDAPQTIGPEIGLVPYVTIERVVYANSLPWPTNADGSGKSLQRAGMTAYGNEPTNWVAATPTAGDSGAQDTDHDGMPDSWEEANGLNKLVNDASQDPDKDGFTNYQEFLAGTNPRSAASYLGIQQISSTAEGTVISFAANPGRSYTIVFTEALPGGAWQKLVDIPASPQAQIISITDTESLSGTGRYYRLVTPALP